LGGGGWFARRPDSYGRHNREENGEEPSKPAVREIKSKIGVVRRPHRSVFFRRPKGIWAGDRRYKIQKRGNIRPRDFIR